MITGYEHIEKHRIPMARSELRSIASELRNRGLTRTPDRIERIVDGLMHRRPPAKPIARATVIAWTPFLVRSIKFALATNPNKHNREIGSWFGVDGGRVSEIAQGIRTEENPTGT